MGYARCKNYTKTNSAGQPIITPTLLIQPGLDKLNIGTWDQTDIFASDRLDIRKNRELKVQATPFEDRPADGQYIPARVAPMEGVYVDLALLH